jgi:hypothetical protein
MESIANKFQYANELFGAILAVDGTHIPIEAPLSNPARYINRKGWHSISFQVACDSNYIIKNVYGGFPGSFHDAYIFRKSPLADWTETIPDPFFILGNVAYPSTATVVTPFKGILNSDQERFNFVHSCQK